MYGSNLGKGRGSYEGQKHAFGIALKMPDCSSAPLCCGFYPQRDASEECDDGNLTNGDGCSTACAVEPGFRCTCTCEEETGQHSPASQYVDCPRDGGGAKDACFQL